MERIYAAGDVSSMSFKQGAFATQQADTVAEAVAAAAGVGITPRPAGPQMRAVLWTEQGPRYLSSPDRAVDERTSSPSRRHLEILHNGRLTARYLSPLVDSLVANRGSQTVEPPWFEAPRRVLIPA